MRFRDQLRDDLTRLPELESALKEKARNLVFMKSLSEATGGVPEGLKKGLEEGLEELRGNIQEVKRLRAMLPEQFVVSGGGDA